MQSPAGVVIEGARVAVFDLNLEAAEKVAAAIRAEGGTAEAFPCDITDRASVDAAVAATEAKLGAKSADEAQEFAAALIAATEALRD